MKLKGAMLLGPTIPQIVKEYRSLLYMSSNHLATTIQDSNKYAIIKKTNKSTSRVKRK